MGDYLISFFLIILSALFSGLTLGFFSLNKDDLQRKADCGDKDAKKVYSLRKNGNLLLCTLLVGNVAVNSALSIYLSSLVSGFIAGLMATGLIVVFGEIIPQASFSRYALPFTSKLVWLVKIFTFILYPICFPFAWMLNKILGEEIPTVYSKNELVKLVEQHEDMKESDIDADEEKIIKGALSFSDKITENIMTPRTEIFALKFDEKLDKKTVEKIFKTGHSRIPVYKKSLDDIIATLYVKDLIINHGANKKVGTVAREDAIFVDNEKPLDDLLDAFKKHRHHLFVVMDQFGSVSGIVTIEDVLEEIIGAEIVDEFDKHVDMQAMAKKRMKKKKINKA